MATRKGSGKLLTIKKSVTTFRTALLLCFICGIFHILQSFQSLYVEVVTYSRNDYLVNTSACQIHDMDAFDDTIKEFYKLTFGRYECKGKESFISITNRTTPVIDEVSLLYNFGLYVNQVYCSYSEIYRDETVPIPDKEFFYTKSRKLIFNKPLVGEYLYVQCSVNKTVFYNEYFLLPVLKDDVERACEDARKGLHNVASDLSVLVLGLDSTSRLNFNRQFLLTGKYLREYLGAYELLGYNKVGLNSLPNQTPLLTGTSLDVPNSSKFYDDLPFLWKAYKRKGYRTIFAEDSPYYGLYTYLAKGLKSQPTDYYPRSAIMSMYTHKTNLKDGEAFCLGEKTFTDVLLDYMVNLTEVLDTRTFFAYFWINNMVHEGVNIAGYLDLHLRDVLKKLDDRGTLNRIVLVLLSDHGVHFGDIRRTPVGRFEDDHPFAFLAFPEWFLNSHPEFAAALETNQRRLTTHFDTHATLLQLATAGLPKTLTDHGQSLFYNVPENRSCARAFIPETFCTCRDWESVSVGDPIALERAQFVIAEVNRIAEAEFPGKCVKWKLKTVLSLNLIPSDHDSDDKARNEAVRLYVIMISAQRSDIIFEATVKQRLVEGVSKLFLERAVDRLDQYDGNVKCVKGKPLRDYCYCKDI